MTDTVTFPMIDEGGGASDVGGWWQALNELDVAAYVGRNRRTVPLGAGRRQ